MMGNIAFIFLAASLVLFVLKPEHRLDAVYELGLAIFMMLLQTENRIYKIMKRLCVK